MATYLLVFRSSADYRPSAETGVAWSAWHQRLGARLKDRGNPIFRAAAVGATPAETVLGGYLLVRAADLDAAIVLARACPGLDSGMSVEVGEITNTDDSFDAWLDEHSGT